ncbi:type II secretion system protein N [Pseudomonas sp. LD120]|uniref:type II secretion system protein N n=1 Tax=Pseudomonas sp. LD120 TaxID=485751 RepID=UPI0013581BEA|nr:type II secretion system protein N [Pseudomonas sp. LD120]KAF0866342.1 general secretion pathway protein GspC [Pseudomonas sp. LD120]
MLRTVKLFPRCGAPQLLQWTALLAALVGVVGTASLLLTPAESHTPQVPAQMRAARVDNPALQWFAQQTAPVQISVSGVLAGARGAVAILQLNDGPPRSFLVGEHLSSGVRLVAIEADAVLIERGAEQSRIKVSTLPDAPNLPRLTR